MRRSVLVIAMLIPLLCPAASPAQYSVATDGWSFHNWNTKPMPWDVYRDTFIGIPPTEDALSSAFDVLFYEQLYKEKLSENGNCFGMSLMSLMMLKNGGHLGFCLPVNQYSGDLVGMGGTYLGPTEPMLKRAINIMHGHQVNLPTVQLILDIIAQHKSRNGSFAYDSFQNAKLQKDFTLISITKSINPADGGHTLVAYDAQDLGGGNKKIFVYDPNRSWADSAAQPWYTGGQNYIAINGDAWSFTMAGTSGTWSGDPGSLSGGNIMIIPISVTGPHTRSPASMGDQIIGRILNELLLTGSSASIEQVTDDNGKRLFIPGTQEIDTSPTGMLSMVPWYPSDQASASAESVRVFFQIGRAGSTLNVSVRSGESGYTLVASGARGRTTVQASGGRGTDVISLGQAGTQQPRVTVRNGRGDATFAVEFLQAVEPRQRLRALKATEVSMPEGASVEFAVGDRSQSLNISSPAAAIRYDLELQNLTRKGIESLSRKGVTHPAGLSQTVRPRDWSRLRAADVLEEALPSRAPVRQAPRSAEPTVSRAS
jgi:hypothetical protein